MRIATAFILSIFFTLHVSAQNGTQGWLQDDKFQRSISVYDPDGKAFTNTYADIEGTPFLFADWKKCNIKLSNGNAYTNVYLKLDLLNQSIHYLASNNAEMEAQPGLIKEVTIIDSSKKGTLEYKFENGFPPFNNKKETDYYEVLSDGKVTLLKLITKKISQEKDEFSGEVKSQFVTNEEYYFFSKIVMQKVRRDKSILELMFDKKEKVIEFINNKNLNYKSIDDIKKIVDYYNSLQ
jgi:hypothetical protein